MCRAGSGSTRMTLPSFTSAMTHRRSHPHHREPRIRRLTVADSHGRDGFGEERTSLEQDFAGTSLGRNKTWNKRLGTKGLAQKKRALSGTRLFLLLVRSVLLEAGRDRVELGVQRGAQVIDDSDDRQRDAGGDQTVFNGGGAGFIFREIRNEVLHKELQMSTRGYN